MARNQTRTQNRLVELLVLLVLLTPLSGALAERRVALIVGNGRYLPPLGQLANPEHDAQLMADTLRGLQFTLVGGKAQLHLSKMDFERAVQVFGSALQEAEIGLFYYAGHGLEVRGVNYLVPVDANPTKESDVDLTMLNTLHVLRQMENSPRTRLKLLVLDACRNNPLAGRGFRSLSGGLAPMDAPAGTLISYATKPGGVAIDGADGNSPYTRALATLLQKPGLDVLHLFNAVAVAVKQQTKGAQEPWQASSPLEGPPFYFAGGGTVPTPSLPPVPPPAPPVVKNNCNDLRLKMSLGVERLSDEERHVLQSQCPY